MSWPSARCSPIRKLLERWSEDAIVWIPDRMPVSGRPAIRRLLADDGFATRGPFHTQDLRLAGGTACETGTLGEGWHRPSTRGEWRVSREIWDL